MRLVGRIRPSTVLALILLSILGLTYLLAPRRREEGQAKVVSLERIYKEAGGLISASAAGLCSAITSLLGYQKQCLGGEM